MSIALKVFIVSHMNFSMDGFRYEYVGDYAVKPEDFEFLYGLEDKVFKITPELFSVNVPEYSSPLDKYDCYILRHADFNGLEAKNVKSMLKQDIQEGLNKLAKDSLEFPYICYQRY